MISPRVSALSRLVAVVLALVLVASACGSSGSDAVESTTDAIETADAEGSESNTNTDDTDSGDDVEAMEDDAGEDTDDIEDAEETGDDAAASDPTAPEDGGPVELPTRSEVIINLVGNMTGHTATDEEIACLSDAADEEPALDEMFVQLGSSTEATVDDAGFAQFAFAANGCVDADVLSNWAALTMGLGDETETTAVADCFGDRFEDGADSGDDDFYGLAARAIGFEIVDEATRLTTIDTLTECVPLNRLTKQLAAQTEAQSQFQVEVDIDCANESLSDAGVSRDFWTTVISGTGEGYAVIDEVVGECSAEYDSGLLKEVPADFEPWAGAGALAAVDPVFRNSVYTEVPPMTIDVSKTYEAVLATGGGEIRVRLFADSAPVTVNNFVNLARDGFYDGTVFHRVLDEFMAQAGDPTGTGTGGPGYQFEDEVDGGPALDKRGLLAMANSGPATNGSQFFITFAPTDWLTGNHTVFGELIEGDDLLAAIELRDPAAPTSRGQLIESITIVES